MNNSITYVLAGGLVVSTLVGVLSSQHHKKEIKKLENEIENLSYLHASEAVNQLIFNYKTVTSLDELEKKLSSKKTEKK